MKTFIDDHDYVSLRADAIGDGDTIHISGRRCVVWGVVAAGDRVELLLCTTSDQPLELLGSTVVAGTDPVWVSAYDAAVTGRVTP